jgi:N-acylneuraminate cytidylyltransferase
VKQQQLDMIYPPDRSRGLPDDIELVVFDFDGVLTDNRVWVDQDGKESVAAYRSDGIGLTRLKKEGVKVFVLSSEPNPVVAMRCKKLEVPVMHGIKSKDQVLKDYLEEKRINPKNVVYLGNDINDVPCFPVVGCAVVVADAHHQAKDKADIILKKNGGYGAVRELCDMITDQMRNASI